MPAAATRLELRLRRRPMTGYAAGMALYTLVVVALYPSFKNSASLNRLSGSTAAALFGVTVTASDGPRVTLEVAGEIAPVLKVIASHDPVDLISRPAGLDELFLAFYRQPANQQVSHAR